jgi:hypothetical protein
MTKCNSIISLVNVETHRVFNLFLIQTELEDTRGEATNYALTRKPTYRTENKYYTNTKEHNKTTRLTNLIQKIKTGTIQAR